MITITISYAWIIAIILYIIFTAICFKGEDFKEASDWNFIGPIVWVLISLGLFISLIVYFVIKWFL